jgi:hypothetical protein
VTTAMDRYISSLDEDGPVEEETYTGLPGLRAMKAGIGRHRLFWTSCVALGLVIGAAFHLVVPAKYTAVTILYLTEPASGSYKVSDDASLVGTNAVAYRAANLLHIYNTNDLPGTWEGVAVGDVLLQIQGNGDTRASAVRWTKALASAFLTVREQTLGEQTQVVVSSLDKQATQLQADVQSLNNTITALSSGGPGDANQVTEMLTERGTDQAQLTTLQNEVQQDLLAETALNTGSYILDPAQAALVHTNRIFAEDGLAGLVAGLAIGTGIIVVGAIISDRPRRRAEVAAVLGAPVELSLRGAPGEPGLLRRTARRRFVKRPGPQLKLAQRRLRERLGQSPRPALALVTTGKGCKGTAAVMLVGTALSLAAEGKRVLLVDMAEGRPLAKLLGSRSKGSAVRTIISGKQQLRLAVAPEDVTTLDLEEVTKDTDAVLLFATADPALGAEHLRRWAGDAVVVLRAGKVSDVLIEAAGQMLREAGVVPVSAILLGADKADETFGTVEQVDQTVPSPLGAKRERHKSWAPSASTSSTT